MRFRDLIATAWTNLWAHRLRAFLSILGVVIGIGSFSIMYSVGEGARQETIRILKEMGSDVLIVTLNTFGGNEDGMAQDILISQTNSLLRECPSVADVSIKITGQISITEPGKAISNFYPANGVSANYQTMFKLEADMGRLFHPSDHDSFNTVCVLGNDMAKRMFPHEYPIGKTVTIKGYLFTIIGVLKRPERMLMMLTDIPSSVLIPDTVADRLFDKNTPPEVFALAEDTEGATLEIQHFLTSRLGNPSRFRIISQRNLLLAREKSVKVIQQVLWAIGSISLLVGGIGIMNIMLVSVTERLREIGIRRALGANRRSIVQQFLMEAILLCLIGAVGGTMLGYFGSRVVEHWTRFTPVFSVELLVLSLLIAALIGIVFGTYPAFRASKLDPSRVLRYE
jgi:putative ABC transport system permease protein